MKRACKKGNENEGLPSEGPHFQTPFLNFPLISLRRGEEEEEESS